MSRVCTHTPVRKIHVQKNGKHTLCSLLGVRRLGTHYRTVSVIHRSAAAALGVVWKLYFSRNTSVLSAIEMLHDIALYKFNIHIHIHIHTDCTPNTDCTRHHRGTGHLPVWPAAVFCRLQIISRMKCSGLSMLNNFRNIFNNHNTLCSKIVTIGLLPEAFSQLKFYQNVLAVGDPPHPAGELTMFPRFPSRPGRGHSFSIPHPS